MIFIHGDRISFRTLDAKDYDVNNPSPHLQDIQSSYLTFSQGGPSHMRPTWVKDRLGALEKMAQEPPSAQASTAWAVQRRIPGEEENKRRDCIGVFQLHGIDEWKNAGFGITVIKELRGQGWGKEILELGLHYAFRLRGIRRLQAIPKATNIAQISS